MSGKTRIQALSFGPLLAPVLAIVRSSSGGCSLWLVSLVTESVQWKSIENSNRVF